MIPSVFTVRHHNQPLRVKVLGRLNKIFSELCRCLGYRSFGAEP